MVRDTFGEGLYIGGSGNTIEGNQIQNTGLRGAEGDCIDLKDGLTEVTIRDNLCHHTQGGNATEISSHSPFTAEGNVIHDTAGHGLAFGTCWGSGLDGVVLRHNLVFNRGGTIAGLEVRANILSRNSPGMSGWGQPRTMIAGDDFYANQPDYAGPFRAAVEPALAKQNLTLDQVFADPDDQAGPDGIFLTSDDGFVPLAPRSPKERPTTDAPSAACRGAARRAASRTAEAGRTRPAGSLLLPHRALTGACERA